MSNIRNIDLPMRSAHISNFGVQQCRFADSAGYVDYREDFQTRIPVDCWTPAEEWIDAQERRIEKWRAQ